MAMRWRTRLSCRLPPRLRRWRSELPDQTGIGAVPLWRAKAAQERNRRTLRPFRRWLLRRRECRSPADRVSWERALARRARRCCAPGLRSDRCQITDSGGSSSAGNLGDHRRAWLWQGPPGGSHMLARSSDRAAGSNAGRELAEVPAQAIFIAVRSFTRSSRWSTSRRSSRSGPSRRATGRFCSAQRHPGDGEGVDRIALAGFTAAPTRAAP